MSCDKHDTIRNGCTTCMEERRERTSAKRFAKSHPANSVEKGFDGKTTRQCPQCMEVFISAPHAGHFKTHHVCKRCGVETAIKEGLEIVCFFCKFPKQRVLTLAEAHIPLCWVHSAKLRDRLFACREGMFEIQR